MIKKTFTMLVISFLLIIGVLSGCNEQNNVIDEKNNVIDEKNKFIGTWKLIDRYTDETWKFYENNTTEQVITSHNGIISSFFNFKFNNDILCMEQINNTQYYLCYNYTFNDDYSKCTLVHDNLPEKIFERVQI